MKKEYIAPEIIEMRLSSAMNVMESSAPLSDEAPVYDEYTDSPSLIKESKTDLWEE